MTSPAWSAHSAMQPSKLPTLEVACPHCGHLQQEPGSAYSTRCKKCQGHFRVQEALHPHQDEAKLLIVMRRVACFQCGTQLEAPAAAQSTICKRCSGHVDLADYQVAQTVFKNFRTHGRLLVEEKGAVLNTEVVAGEAVLKGRLIGKVKAARLEIHSSARIQGTISGGVLVIPAGQHFAWPDVLRMGGAEISGELAANLITTGSIVLRSTARFFGEAQGPELIVEAGSVLVGSVHISKLPGP